MPTVRFTFIAPLALALLLSACTTVEPPPPAPATTAAGVTSEATGAPREQAEIPELQLNLPQQNDNCNCAPVPVEDYTFFDKGYRSLLDGEYRDAMQHFERYQRLESSPRADLEAGIAIAYLRMLPRSPFYDPVVARDTFRVLREKNAKDLKVNESTRLMRQALLNMLQLQKKIDQLKQNNKTLKVDLEKREEALKRLRELTLSQKGTSP